MVLTYLFKMAGLCNLISAISLFVLVGLLYLGWLIILSTVKCCSCWSSVPDIQSPRERIVK